MALVAVVLTIFLPGGAALAIILLAWLLYPLSKSPRETPFSSRGLSWGFYYFSPKTGGVCAWLSRLTGYSKHVISRQIFSSLTTDANSPTVKKRDLKIANIPVRLYQPISVRDGEKVPVIVFFHGGGYTTCSIASHDPVCLRICEISKMAVVSVDYRMAPEHIYPAAVDDCLAVVTALSDDEQYSEDLGIDSTSISVAGDSAGGGLTAAVALKWRSMGRRNLRAQVLIYPYLQVLSYKLPSYVTEERSVGSLNKDMMLYFSSVYVWGNTMMLKDLESRSLSLLPRETWRLVDRRLGGEPVDIDRPPPSKYPHAERLLSETLSPLLAEDVSGVAPAFVALAGHDVLRSDGELYAKKLKAAGVEVSLVLYPHELHAFFAGVSVPNPGFLDRLAYNKNADDLTEKMTRFIQQHSV